MKMKRLLSAGLIGVMGLSALAFTGCCSDSAGGDSTVSWWITMTDGNGVYYDNYEDNPCDLRGSHRSAEGLCDALLSAHQ